MVNYFRKLLNSQNIKIKKPSEIISKGHNHKPIHHRRIDIAKLINLLTFTWFFLENLKKK